MKKRMIGLLLSVVLLIPCISPSLTVRASTTSNDTADLDAGAEQHIYDYDIVDGGVYFLRNRYTGNYLNVDNAGVTSGTNISACAYHGQSNQQFKVSYMGRGIYELSPVYVDMRLHIDGDNLVIQNKNRSSAQRFRFEMNGINIAIIYSESSEYTKVLYEDNESRVYQETYGENIPLMELQRTNWVFERVNYTDKDEYNIYYIRNAETHQFLDVKDRHTTEGSLVHACGFYGGSNQEWKLDYFADGTCTLIPGHRRDMALDYRDANVNIYADDNPSTQKLVFSEQAVENGKTLYYIQTPDGENYLTLGAVLEPTMIVAISPPNLLPTKKVYGMWNVSLSIFMIPLPCG